MSARVMRLNEQWVEAEIRIYLTQTKHVYIKLVLNAIKNKFFTQNNDRKQSKLQDSVLKTVANEMFVK